MAQPNVSREPSMEEILASIRRIIESNEPAPGRSFNNYGYDNEVDELDIAGDAFSVEALPMELPVAANQPGPVSDQSNAADRGHINSQPMEDAGRSVQKPVSLADLAARVRATAERRDEPPVPEFAHESQPQQRDAGAIASFGSPVAGGFSDMPMARARIAEPEAMSASQRHIEALLQSEPMSPASVAASLPAEQPATIDRREEEQQQVRQDHQDSDRNGLLSMQAGAQVAKSFEELAAVVDGQQRRSLDEIAQDMLRPMLQDWLDDNLPTLVERLVREEIERIARGPRR